MRTALLVAGVILAAAQAPCDEVAEALTRGKLAADLGDYGAAAAAFASVADDPGASRTQRWEALVRLGVARREDGDRSGSIDTFERVWHEHAADAEALRFLLEALGSGLPGPERWDQVWKRVSIEFDRATSEAHVLWPDAPPGLCPCDGTPVSLDSVDRGLHEMLRLMADVSGLNMVVQPGVRGTVTFRVHERPWDEALELLLAPNGYVARRHGSVIWVGRVSEAPGARPHRFTGKAIDFEFTSVDLIEALGRVAKVGGARVEAADGVAGRVTIKLSAVPWDQAFDLLARTNGLTWERHGDVIHVATRRSAGP